MSDAPFVEAVSKDHLPYMVSLMALYGQLQGIELAVYTARHAVADHGDPQQAELIEYLFKLQFGLCRAQGRILEAVAPSGGPR